MQIISGKTNKLVKDTKKLINSASARREQGLFVLEGARLCFDVLNSVYKVRQLFVTEKVMQKYPDEVESLCNISGSAYIITEEVSSKLSDTESPQGIFAVCEMQNSKRPLGKRVLALDNLQDPGNVGSVIRTAEALGIDSLIIYGGCDIYNPKVLRASMGSVLRMNIIQTDSLCDTLNALRSEYYCIVVTVPKQSARSISAVDFIAKTVCVIGNEANGVSKEVIDLADFTVTIPMKGRAESLNASVAASITMWEMMRSG
ncbi:MAG: RNA methyltransferase [Ruminococcaceae bacterium]|nr:RNA methyltransferase [Oscillospiraceae bacterium]